jgi:hypothetical protein
MVCSGTAYCNNDPANCFLYDVLNLRGHVCSKPSLSVESVSIISHTRRLLVNTIFHILRFFNHPAFVNVPTVHVVSRAGGFSLSTALMLFRKSAVVYADSIFMYLFIVTIKPLAVCTLSFKKPESQEYRSILMILFLIYLSIHSF